jgi:NNP family nitrate/nitrite transporter-like MFS transporter
VLGSLPVFLVGLSHDYTSFLLFRLGIGVIGASFVITQFHTSMMFAPAIKGTANAFTGGWGNLGGGVTNMVMPLVFSCIVGMGYAPHLAWRYAMILPGLLMLGIAWLYYKYTTDTPGGNFSHRSTGAKDSAGGKDSGTGKGAIGNEGAGKRHKTDWSVLADLRIWALVIAYAMCFGMELTFDNVASLHFVDTFKLSQATAGVCAGIFGAMNLFARALGGFFSDKAGRHYGMRGKGLFLAGALLLEGIGLILFGLAASLPLAIGLMLFFALFLKMANGATFGIVPFVNEKNVGLVSGIVGAGGNLGGVLFGFLFKSTAISYAQAFQYIGLTVIGVALIVVCTRFALKSSAQTVRVGDTQVRVDDVLVRVGDAQKIATEVEIAVI